MLKDWDACEVLLERLKEDGNVRDYLLFGIGLYTAFRVSDYNSLRWKDIVEIEMKDWKTPVATVRDQLLIQEKKTAHIKRKRPRKVYFSPAFKKIVLWCWEHEHPDFKRKNAYLFRRRCGEPMALTRQGVNYILKSVTEKYDISPNLLGISSHSLRKQFAHNTGDVYLANLLLGHSDIKTTMVYMGYDDDRAKKYYESLK